ncbi:MAG: hypothetical protein R2788_19300 [Saprospiraceae bacterium]
MKKPPLSPTMDKLFFLFNGPHRVWRARYFHVKVTWEDIWSEPVNLGMPSTPAYRELGFFLSGDSKTGYFASDRKEALEVWTFIIFKFLTPCKAIR